MSLADLETLYQAAIAAVEAGNYDTAIQRALACKMRLATMPDVERPDKGGGIGRMMWANAAAIDGFIAECKQLRASAAAASTAATSNGRSGPFQRTRITYGRPSNDSDCY